MKKIFALVAAVFCFSAVAFADEIDDLLKPQPDNGIETIIPEDQHVTNKTARVELQYTPLTDEVRLFYTCHAVAFDQGEAMNTALAVFRKGRTPLTRKLTRFTGRNSESTGPLHTARTATSLT